MTEDRVESWLELQGLLFADSWNDELGLFRSSYAYRGCPDAAGDLRSGVAVDVRDTDARALLREEHRRVGAHAAARAGDHADLPLEPAGRHASVE